MSTTTPTRQIADVFPEHLRPFLGPVVAVGPHRASFAPSRAQEMGRRLEAARQSLMVQQIVAGVGFSYHLATDQHHAQAALALRGWDPTRWAVANVPGGTWAGGSLVNHLGRFNSRIEFHCGNLAVAEAVRVTFTAYDLAAGLGPDELSVMVIL